MSKQEFLENLRRSLSSGLEYSKVEEHMRYYSDYIDSRIRQGEREEDIMAQLGEPRLIAKTLVGINEGSGATEEYVEEDVFQANHKKNYQINLNGKTIDVPAWALTLFGGVAAVFLLFFVILIFAGALKIAFPILIVLFVFRFFKRTFFK